MATTKIDMTNPALVLESLKSRDTNGYDTGLLKTSIRTIATAGSKLDARIHATACALLERAADHRDCSLVPSLVEAMPKSSRRKALIAWFHAYSNVRIVVSPKGEVTAGVPKVDSKLYVEPRSADAFAKPFWSVEEKETDPRAFDDAAFAKAVQSLIARAKSDAASLSPAAAAALADLSLVGQKLAPAA
jgi:hypothetical protein